MNKKDIVLGIFIGLIANGIGIFLAAKLLGNEGDFISVIKTAITGGFLGKLVSLGAILNLIVFFIFIKKKQDNRARGVLLATVFIAIFTFAVKF